MPHEKTISNDLMERVARACAYAVEMQHSTLDVVKRLGFSSIEAFVDKAWPNYLPQANAAIAIIRAEVLEEAAKVCDEIENKLTDEWRAGLKCDSHLEGASSGAFECAAAIRKMKEVL